RKGAGEREALMMALGELHAAGATLAWENVLEDLGARQTELPTYAFRRERFRLEEPASRGSADRGVAGVLARGDIDALAADLRTRGLNTERDGVLETLRSLVDPPRESSQGERLAAVTWRLDWVPLAGSPAYRPVGAWLIISDDTD